MNVDVSGTLALWMANVLVQATVVTIVALIAAVAVRRSAVTRAWIFSAAIVLLLAAPWIACVMQSTGAGLVALSSTATGSNLPAGVDPSGPADSLAAKDRPQFADAEVQPESRLHAANADRAPDITQQETAQSDAADDNSSEQSGSRAANTEPGTALVPEASSAAVGERASWTWLAIPAILVWLGGTLICLVRLVRAHREICRFLKAAHAPSGEVEAAVTGTLEEIRSELGIARPFQLLISAEVTTPLVAGILRPVIVMPRDLLHRISPTQLRAVLVHECAHIVRRDPWVALLQNLAGICYWFHPLVLVVNRRLRQAREEICDNYVLRSTSAPGYGRALLLIAEWIAGRKAWPAAVPFLDAGWNLEDRIEQILQVDRRKATHLSGRSAVGVIVMTVLVGAAMAMGTFGSAHAGPQDTREVAPSPPERGENSLTTMQNRAAGQQPAVDLYGDEIPYRAAARLGTLRFRTGNESWGHKLYFTEDSQELALYGPNADLTWMNVETGKISRFASSPGEEHSWAASGLSPDKTRLALITNERLENNQRRPRLRLLEARSLQVLATTDFGITTIGEEWDNFAFSADNKLLVLGSGRGELKVLDGQTLRPHVERTLIEPRQSIESLAVSPDGSLIVIGTTRELFLWDWQSGGDPTPVPARSRIADVQFDPRSGDLFVSSLGDTSHDLQITRWNAAFKQPGNSLEMPTEAVNMTPAPVFTRDGKYLVAVLGVYRGSPDWDDDIVIWELASGKIVRRIKAGRADFRGLAVSPDGKRIATLASYWACVWDFETGEPLHRTPEAHTDHIERIIFSPDSKQVVTASSDWTARAWDASSGRQLYRLDLDHWVRGLDVSPDGKWLATATLHDTVSVWNLATGESRYQWHGTQSSSGRCEVRFSGDSQMLTSWADGVPFLRRWDLNTGRLVSERRTGPDPGPMGFAETPKCILAPSGTQAAFFTGGVDLWNCAGGEVERTIPAGETPFESGCYSPDSKKLLLSRQHFDPDNPIVRTSFEARFEYLLFDLEANSALWTHVTNGRIGSIAYSPDGKLVAVTEWQADAELIDFLDANTGEKLGQLKINGRLGFLNPERMAFSPDGQKFAAALMDTTVLVWNLADLGLQPK